MRNLVVLLFLVFTVHTIAQTGKNCSTPISNYVFSQKFSSLKNKTGDAQKLISSKNLAKNNCLSTAQVKQIAELFENDYNRLAFVEEAYLNTTDKDNFYEVYNTFMYFSTVFRLHDYIAEKKGNGNKTVVVEQPVNKEMTFPDIQYPDFRSYFGKTGCTNIIQDQNFMELAKRIFNEKVEYRKLMVANNSIRTTCFQAAQAMKLASLIKSERDRLTFLKKAHAKVYDQDNYRYAAQLFTQESNRMELKKLLSPNVELVIAEKKDEGCHVSDSEFQELKSQIVRERFNNTKINLTKQILRSKKCFSTKQVIELVRLFPYNDAKLEIAKYAYDYTTDKDNYYQVANTFNYARYKDELLRYIKNK